MLCVNMYQCVCLSIKFTISLRFGLFNIYLISMVNTVERKYMIITGNCKSQLKIYISSFSLYCCCCACVGTYMYHLYLHYWTICFVFYI